MGLQQQRQQQQRQQHDAGYCRYSVALCMHIAGAGSPSPAGAGSALCETSENHAEGFTGGRRTPNLGPVAQMRLELGLVAVNAAMHVVLQVSMHHADTR